MLTCPLHGLPFESKLVETHVDDWYVGYCSICKNNAISAQPILTWFDNNRSKLPKNNLKNEKLTYYYLIEMFSKRLLDQYYELRYFNNEIVHLKMYKSIKFPNLIDLVKDKFDDTNFQTVFNTNLSWRTMRKCGHIKYIDTFNTPELPIHLLNDEYLHNLIIKGCKNGNQIL